MRNVLFFFLGKNLGTLYVKRNEMYGKLLRRNKKKREVRI